MKPQHWAGRSWPRPPERLTFGYVFRRASARLARGSKACLLVDELGEIPPLFQRQIGRGDVEFRVVEPGGPGKTVPGSRPGKVTLKHAANGVEMRNSVLGNGVAVRGGDKENLHRASFVLRHALAI